MNYKFVSLIALFKVFATQINLLIFLAIFLLISSCIKHKTIEPDNPYGLPNATQEGKNIFACRVNGENWIGKEKPGLDYYIDVYFKDSFMVVRGTQEKDKTLERYNIIVNTKYLLTNINIPLYDTINSYPEFYVIGTNCFINTGGYGSIKRKGYEGGLTITRADTIKKIVSGTFWFNILTDYCDTMKVTDGRFDIRYY